MCEEGQGSGLLLRQIIGTTIFVDRKCRVSINFDSDEMFGQFLFI